ncbi:hypothetical protein D477_016605 [Arthrobacter crystallopoietes BAB-32]|uniref:Uncharacterized protein n=2 Tax=Crystallibacter crystallopoietes TaxID=37928 RepID=N1UVL6_9MICC|nr:hypothetical protein D477_016605 [Arthrobacter crystallopoietes BAB-32]
MPRPTLASMHESVSAKQRLRTAAAFTALATSILLTACTPEAPEQPASASPHATTSATAASSPAEAPPSSVPRTPDAAELARLNTQLQLAAADNDPDRIRVLLQRGADLEARNDDGRTPLVTATKANNVQAARTLIEAGADVNAKDDIEDSAYLYAGAEGFNEILELTLDHGADLASTNRFGGTALIPACEHAHVETVRILLAAGVDVDHVNTPGWTCLLEAVVFGTGSADYQNVVQQVIDAGADLDIPDANGVTALQHAEARGQSAVAELLRAAGAN